jgi:hypothetical protein
MNWINVKERLPPGGILKLTKCWKSVPILVYSKAGGQSVGRLINPADSEFYKENYMDFPDNVFVSENECECELNYPVTHWMPLPDPPK